MNPVLLIDFGSTYTKLTAVDIDRESILGTSQAYSTVHTDINDGLQEGLKLLEEQTGPTVYNETYACSSAAGGLRMITSGLVPDLTSKPQMASLGAPEDGTSFFELTEDIEESEMLIPISSSVGMGQRRNQEYHPQLKMPAASLTHPITETDSGKAAEHLKVRNFCERERCLHWEPSTGTQDRNRDLFRGSFRRRVCPASGTDRIRPARGLCRLEFWPGG